MIVSPTILVLSLSLPYHFSQIQVDFNVHLAKNRDWRLLTEFFAKKKKILTFRGSGNVLLFQQREDSKSAVFWFIWSMLLLEQPFLPPPSQRDDCKSGISCRSFCMVLPYFAQWINVHRSTACSLVFKLRYTLTILVHGFLMGQQQWWSD